jgi:hypothetical protein
MSLEALKMCFQKKKKEKKAASTVNFFFNIPLPIMKTSLKKIDLMFTSPLNIYWSLS